jgi:hypothetical protein
LETRLLSVHEGVKDRVQILLDGVPCRDVSLLVIEINNSGNEPIRSSDFERPLRFNCGKEAQLLSLVVDATKPDDLRPAVKSATNEVELTPLLLNKGDWMRIIVLAQDAGAVSPDGRIAGVGTIKKRSNIESTVTILERFSSSMAVVSLALFALPVHGVLETTVYCSVIAIVILNTWMRYRLGR